MGSLFLLIRFLGRLRSKETSSVSPAASHLPQRGRLIYTSTSLENIHLEQTAYRYLLHRGAKYHHGKVKACRDAKGAEKESRGRRGGMCPPIRPLGPAQRVPAGETRDFLKRTKLLCASICTDRFFKQERAALGPRGAMGDFDLPPLPPWIPPTPLETTRGAPLDPGNGIRRLTDQTFFLNRSKFSYFAFSPDCKQRAARMGSPFPYPFTADQSVQTARRPRWAPPRYPRGTSPPLPRAASWPALHQTRSSARSFHSAGSAHG